MERPRTSDDAQQAGRLSRRSMAATRRTRTGCFTCRDRRIKCDERKPTCVQCQKGQRTCDWSGAGRGRRLREPRRPNATSCHGCREKKLKCIGDVSAACDKCKAQGIECIRISRGRASSSMASDDIQSSTTQSPAAASGSRSGRDIAHRPRQESPAAMVSSETGTLGQMPTGEELQSLVNLYFDSVHQYGFFAYIHPMEFKRLLARGKAPHELALIMIASAMRFAGEPTAGNLAKADAWADAAINALLPRIYQGFGVIQLMILLLAHHYELSRGHFTSAWLLGANCTRMMQMMSLHTFDRPQAVKPPETNLPPLLSREALRRVAWSAFVIDSVVDGGRYGFHTIDEKAYRLQLPCDQASFLSDESVVTEPLLPAGSASIYSGGGRRDYAPLDLSAYFIRTMAARRRALHFAFRASHREQPVEQLSAELSTLEEDIQEVIADLPKRFHFNADNLIVHRDRLIMFIFLHVLRHNLYIVATRAALHIFLRDPAKADYVCKIRRQRISHALSIAGLVTEGLKAQIPFDPQYGVQSYVALEILLFEPRRLAETDPLMDPRSSELMAALSHLLAVVRTVADRSEFVKQLHIEAVLRLLRCDCSHLLRDADYAALRSEYQLVGQDTAEYDFRDFRWAKLERIRRGARSSANMARDESLLEFRLEEEPAVPSATASPRLEALDANQSLNRGSGTETGQSSSSQIQSDIPPAPLDIPELYGWNGGGTGSWDETSPEWWGFVEPENAYQMFSLNWPWWLSDRQQPSEYLGDEPSRF